MRKSIKMVLGSLLFLAVIVFVARHGLRVAESFGRSIWDFHPGAVFAAASLVLLGYLNRFFFWFFTAKRFGMRMGLVRAAKLFYTSTLAKYVPGKLGLVLVRAQMASPGDKSSVVASTMAEYAASFAAAGSLALLGLLFAMDLSSWLVPVLAIGVVFFLAIIHPVVFQFLGRLWARLAKKPLPVEIPPYRYMMRAYVGLLITGLLQGAALHVLLSSIYPGLLIDSYLSVTGAYYLASVGGLMAVFAPGGLGVREGLLFVLLPSIVPEGSAVSGASVMRAITLSAELILATIFWFTYRITGDNSPREDA